MPLLALLLACGTPSTPSPAPAGPLDQGWVAAVVHDPTAFTAAIEPQRAGWVALHKNDWPAAAAEGGVVGGRARAELAQLHTVLAGVADQVFLSMGSRWVTVGGPPADSVFPLLAWWAAVDAGDTASAETWKARAAASTSPLAKARASAGDPFADVADALQPRVTLHRAARAGTPTLGQAERDLLSQPVATEGAGDAKRELWDPLVHRTYAAAWRAEAAPPAEGLAGSLFSTQLAGPMPLDASLTALGLAVPGGTDSPEECRQLVRDLDTRLDPWGMQLGTSATDDGKALLADLQLVPGTRARVLVALAVEALDAQHPNCALAYAEMARDHARGREITPVNSPTLYAVLTAANLRTGHTREALDALEVLAGAYPEVHGLDEAMGDLAVLEGIHRAGDSREN